MITNFVYDGRSLADFGYLLVIEGEEDTVNISNIEYDTIKSARNDRSYNVGYKYGENYSRTYFIMKNLCNDPEDEFLTDYDISELMRWLCRKQYKWLKFVDEDNMGADDEIWYQAYFTAEKEYVGEHVIGLRLTVHTNAPYGFTRLKRKEFTDTYFTLNVNTDEEGYIYPDVTIQVGTPGTLQFINTTENRITELKNCVRDEIIVLSGYDIQEISSTNTNHDYITEFNYKFPRLFYEYNNGINKFSVNLYSKVTMEYREIRKVGLK